MGVRILVGFSFGLIMGVSCVTCSQGFSGGEMSDELAGTSGRRVGVVELVGPIMDTKETVRAIKRFSRRDELDALVVRIDSPGGAVAPSQEIYAAMREASESGKPVVVSMGSVAASGGFWAAMGADYIFASPGSITGSIGVISQSPDLRELAKLARVEMRTYKSGKHKDLGNPLREMTPEDDAIFMALINDVYEQFVDVISKRRGLERAKVLAVADGRVMTGKAAHEAGLIDELGGLYAAAKKAVALADERKLAKGEKVPEKQDGDPTLVYPRRRMSLMQMLTEDVGASLVRGALGGLEDGLRAASQRFDDPVRAEM